MTVRDLGWSKTDVLRWTNMRSVAEQEENPEPTINDLIAREQQWIEGSQDPNRPSHEYALGQLLMFSVADRTRKVSEVMAELNGK